MLNNRDSDWNLAFLLSSEHMESSRESRLFASDDLTKSYVLREHKHSQICSLSGINCLVV